MKDRPEVDAEVSVGAGDPREAEASEKLEEFFETHKEGVFYSRQLEVRHEDEWFHWVTNRALRDLVARDVVRSEERLLATGQTIILMWHRSYRYYKRAAAQLVELVEDYSDPNIGGALGLQGEHLVLEGFAGRQFLMHGRNSQEFAGRRWARTAHDLDFIFERDGVAYGIEVKNTLGYMDHEELEVKIELCEELGLRPVFAARMLPKTWINEVNDAGGFGLILKYQLYPWAHRDLAKKVQKELGLPVAAPKALEDGTMDRFEGWHKRQV